MEKTIKSIYNCRVLFNKVSTKNGSHPQKIHNSDLEKKRRSQSEKMALNRMLEPLLLSETYISKISFVFNKNNAL